VHGRAGAQTATCYASTTLPLPLGYSAVQPDRVQADQVNAILQHHPSPSAAAQAHCTHFGAFNASCIISCHRQFTGYPLQRCCILTAMLDKGRGRAGCLGGGGTGQLGDQAGHFSEPLKFAWLTEPKSGSPSQQCGSWGAQEWGTVSPLPTPPATNLPL
jgi:hypothetical protein